jgi:hypothetical protein
VREHLPVILIEVVLVFGGVLAFAWWQFRDLARERRKRQPPSGTSARGDDALIPPAADGASQPAGRPARTRPDAEQDRT